MDAWMHGCMAQWELYEYYGEPITVNGEKWTFTIVEMKSCVDYDIAEAIASGQKVLAPYLHDPEDEEIVALVNWIDKECEQECWYIDDDKGLAQFLKDMECIDIKCITLAICNRYCYSPDPGDDEYVCCAFENMYFHDLD